ncbi:MAG: transcription antitermination factor NusB [Ignavibacteriales bacterium]|nr:transcription antitermination factor NusB [Ignavibacteriales bacterium]
MIKKSLRRILRERAVQVLYAYEYNAEGRENLMQGFLADIMDDPSRDFFRSLIDRCVIHKKEFDEILKNYAQNWEVDRITIIDKSILYIGFCELMYFADIPPKVTINECIELAKEFGTDDSSKFTNGLLDKVYEDLKNDNKIRKIGRGLVD